MSKSNSCVELFSTLCYLSVTSIHFVHVRVCVGVDSEWKLLRVHCICSVDNCTPLLQRAFITCDRRAGSLDKERTTRGGRGQVVPETTTKELSNKTSHADAHGGTWSKPISFKHLRQQRRISICCHHRQNRHTSRNKLSLSDVGDLGQLLDEVLFPSRIVQMTVLYQLHGNGQRALYHSDPVHQFHLKT